MKALLSSLFSLLSSLFSLLRSRRIVQINLVDLTTTVINVTFGVALLILRKN